MKTIIPLLLFICSFNLYGQKKTHDIDKNDIIGRWESFTYNLEENPAIKPEPMNVYYFKDNMVFHRGEIVDGAIIFNITGRYSVEGDSIKLVYQDYLKQTTYTRETKTMILKIFYRSDNRLDMDIISPDDSNPITFIRQGYTE